MMWIQAISLLCALAGGQDDPPEGAKVSPAAYWRRVAKVEAVRPGHRSVASRDEKGRATGAAARRDAQPRPSLQQRIAKLRGRIKGAEEDLLYATLPEERALAYNAKRRKEMRSVRMSLEVVAQEREDVLRELSEEYRSQSSGGRPLLGQRWMRANRGAVLSQIQSCLRSQRRVGALDTALANLDASDERLRALISKKKADRESSRRQQTVLIDESFSVDLPAPVVVEEEPELSPAELEMFKKLFPTGR